ncbi:uncharacterized protein KY384_003134 [Bacidia gigantensis]|uniref:uncharacterized protein n=1 Tax=Bacidia gigantensis TaxID=2732470 RepID=UPI001D05A21E|nr:uncharacterized protein KY384_003134 [Bacidia gigantensis]KAG8531505.1 hypothetical protein KY384_003134 [Bacidia gigantensis]
MGGEIHQPGSDDGWHGVIAPGGRFAPEKDRYHLYFGLFCPFAHRANLVRHLKGLTAIVPTSIVRPYPRGGDQKFPSWIFPENDDEYPGATPDHLYHSKYLSEIYFKADPDYQGKYSVPLLWDKKLGTIVNNESAELLRWLPTAFDSILTHPIPLDLYPLDLRPVIDMIGPWLQSHLNTGVYKAGFAADQVIYDKNVIPVFGALNKLEQLIHANGGPFVLGERLTELDIRLYATVIRFDMVYVQHFKCNLGTVRHNYPVLNTWLRHVYWAVPGFKDSTNSTHIKEDYTKGMPDINPKGITPMGPYPDVEVGAPSRDEWKNLKPGGIKLEEVQNVAEKLPA